MIHERNYYDSRSARNNAVDMHKDNAAMTWILEERCIKQKHPAAKLGVFASM